jgi:hypothetical protein
LCHFELLDPRTVNPNFQWQPVRVALLRLHEIDFHFLDELLVKLSTPR